MSSAEPAANVALKHENVYLDLTLSSSYAEIIEYFVKTCSADKILHGSDAAWFPVHSAISRVVCAKITDGDKRKILGLNAKRIFNFNLCF